MLTAPQQQTLKTFMANTPALNAYPNTLDGAFEIAAAINTKATPDFYVWRTSVAVDEIMQNGFDWTRVDNLTVGKARIMEWMMLTGRLNLSQANVRAGVLACFSTAGDLANRNAVFGHCQRTATVAEKLFATGAGTSTTDQGVGPATMSIEGAISPQDVYDARNAA